MRKKKSFFTLQVNDERSRIRTRTKMSRIHNTAAGYLIPYDTYLLFFAITVPKERKGSSPHMMIENEKRGACSFFTCGIVDRVVSLHCANKSEKKKKKLYKRPRFEVGTQYSINTIVTMHIAAWNSKKHREVQAGQVFGYVPVD
jgi:hypothetical protein